MQSAEHKEATVSMDVDVTDGPVMHNDADLAFISAGLQQQQEVSSQGETSPSISAPQPVSSTVDGSARPPALDPALMAKIELMRARMRQMDEQSAANTQSAPSQPSDGTNVARDESDQPSVEVATEGPTALNSTTATATAATTQTSAEPTAAVNFSILDRALATHGFEAIDDDDDDDDDEDDSDDDDSDESSDDSDDESSSSSDESDVPRRRAPLTREERERILQAADGDDDDDTPGGVLRTKNERQEDDLVQVPNFTLPPTEPIEVLGQITRVVGTACVVTGIPQPQTKVLDVGSLLCFADRSNLGYVADTFGPVILPMFTVRFKTTEDMAAAGVATGKQVFWVPAHAVWVFNDTLRVKGSDASNLHDEEVGQDEVEFSDDEQEAEYKRMLKQQRKAARGGGDAGGTSGGGRGGRGRGRGRGAAQSSRPPRPLNDLDAIAQSQGLQYDPRAQRLVVPPSQQVGAHPGYGYTSQMPPPPPPHQVFMQQQQRQQPQMDYGYSSMPPPQQPHGTYQRSYYVPEDAPR